MSPNRELATKTVSYLQLLKAVIPAPADWKPAAFEQKFREALYEDYALRAQAAYLVGTSRKIILEEFRANYAGEATSIAQTLSTRLKDIDEVLGLSGLYASAAISSLGEVTASALRTVAMARFNEAPAKAALVAEILNFFPSFLQDLLHEIKLRLKTKGFWRRCWLPDRRRDSENEAARKIIKERLGGLSTDTSDAAARRQLLENPDGLLALAEAILFPLPFDLVQNEELDEIEKRRRNSGAQVPVGSVQDGARRALDSNLIGLAFSGGGIRSATFNLGILQALAGFKMLRHIDYFSTVSGGGYIGAWLTAWIKRAHSMGACRNVSLHRTQPEP